MNSAKVLDFKAARNEKRQRKIALWLNSLPLDEYEKTIKVMEETIKAAEDEDLLAK